MYRLHFNTDLTVHCSACGKAEERMLIPLGAYFDDRSIGKPFCIPCVHQSRAARIPVWFRTIKPDVYRLAQELVSNTFEGRKSQDFLATLFRNKSLEGKEILKRNGIVDKESHDSFSRAVKFEINFQTHYVLFFSVPQILDTIKEIESCLGADAIKLVKDFFIDEGIYHMKESWMVGYDRLRDETLDMFKEHYRVIPARYGYMINGRAFADVDMHYMIMLVKAVINLIIATGVFAYTDDRVKQVPYFSS